MFGFDLKQIKEASPLGEMISKVIGVPVDCKGLNLLSESSQTIPGLYKETKAAYESGNPVLAMNLKWGDNPFSPANVAITYGADAKLVCTYSTLQIIVATNDSVTIVNMAPSN